MSSIKGVQGVINLLNRAVDPKRLKESTQKLAEMGDGPGLYRNSP